MSTFKKKIVIPFPHLIVCGCLALIAIFVYLSSTLISKKFFDPEGPFFLFIVGLVPGLVVALGQFILSWSDFKANEKISAMKIKQILSRRDNEVYYRELLAKARASVDLLGVTAHRFIADFADAGSNNAQKKIFIQVLERGVKVRFLLPSRQNLLNIEDQEKFDVVVKRLDALSKNYENFLLEYFDHLPVASIFRVDEDIIVGPVFSNEKSRNTPAIHTVTESEIGQCYLAYFDHEWKVSQNIQPQS